MVAVDFAQDGLADVSSGPIVCQNGPCTAFAAPDVDGDGFDEIAVTVGSTGGSTMFDLYNGAGLQRLGFDCSNCSSGPFFWGGPGGHVEGAYCLPENAIGDFVIWSAEQTANGDRYALAEVFLDVKGPFLSEVDQRDSFVAFDHSALPPGGGDDLCGSPVSARSS